MVSRSAEQYLKVLLAFEGKPDFTMTQVARLLGVSSASVTGMAKRLTAQGLLRHQPYGGMELTQEGREAALRLLRRHRIAELYLFEKLGYPLFLVHDEADALEHHISDYLEERMSGVLDNPAFDPHGHPIPDPDGRLPDFFGSALPEASTGKDLTVVSVPDHDPLFLRHLVDIGCVPGSHIRVVRLSTEASTVTFTFLNGSGFPDTGDAEHSVSADKARNILVCSADAPQSQSFARFLSHRQAREN